jgi:hypothetical protein
VGVAFPREESLETAQVVRLDETDRPLASAMHGSLISEQSLTEKTAGAIGRQDAHCQQALNNASVRNFVVDPLRPKGSNPACRSALSPFGPRWGVQMLKESSSAS